MPIVHNVAQMSITPTGPEADALALLGVQAGPQIGEEVPVLKPVVRIGRSPQNDVVITDDSVSTTHARLDYDGGGWRLTDLGSTNGTYVEGTRLAAEVPTPLVYGASLRLGGVRLQFRAVEDADPAAARDQYEEPPPPTRLADQRQGLRIPVWFVVILLILLVIAALLFTGVLAIPTASAAVSATAGSGALAAPLLATSAAA